MTCFRWLRLACFGVIGCFLAIGCGTQSSSQTTVKNTEVAVELSEVTYAGLDAVVKEQKGKVVIIDVWFKA